MLALLMLAHVIYPGEVTVASISSMLDRIVLTFGGPVRTIACLGGMAWVFGYINIHLTRNLSTPTVTLSRDLTGTIQMETQSISSLARGIALQGQDVTAVRCRVKGSDAGVSIEILATLHMGSNARAATAAMQQDIREVVERTTGLKVQNVKVRVRYNKRSGKPPARAI